MQCNITKEIGHSHTKEYTIIYQQPKTLTALLGNSPMMILNVALCMWYVYSVMKGDFPVSSLDKLCIWFDLISRTSTGAAPQRKQGSTGNLRVADWNNAIVLHMEFDIVTKFQRIITIITGEMCTINLNLDNLCTMHIAMNQEFHMFEWTLMKQSSCPEKRGFLRAWTNLGQLVKHWRVF